MCGPRTLNPPLEIVATKLRLHDLLANARTMSTQGAWHELQLDEWVHFNEEHLQRCIADDRVFRARAKARAKEMARAMAHPKANAKAKARAKAQAKAKAEAKAKAKANAKAQAKAKAKANPQDHPNALPINESDTDPADSGSDSSSSFPASEEGDFHSP